LKVLNAASFKGRSDFLVYVGVGIEIDDGVTRIARDDQPVMLRGER
jgi:hypothetical protein